MSRQGQISRSDNAENQRSSFVTPPAASAPRPSLAVIFSVFFRIGLFSFGGGLSGWIYREAVTRRNWIDEDEFMSGLAISQILPGTNVSNLTIYVGQKLRGLTGAGTALLGLLSGPFFAVIALASVYGVLKTLSYSTAVMDGVAAAAIGLLLIVIARGTLRSARSAAGLAALFGTFAGVAVFHWSLPLVVAVIGPLSVVAAWLRSAPREG